MPPLLTLTDIGHRFGAHWLFQDLGLTVAPHDRLCLVGRNGTGKSTLMKIMAGAIEPEHGARWVQPGATVAYLDQEPDFSAFATVEDAILDGMPEALREPHRADAIAAELRLDPEAAPRTLSGGGGRRLALARIFAAPPDILLMDEPTNHLDLTAIGWLEERLLGFRGALVVISHDRRLLARVSDATLWLDRGALHRGTKGFADFAAWSEEILAAQEKAASRADQHLKAELHWLARGVTARRKRNQGRLKKLEALRAERRARPQAVGTAAVEIARGAASGNLVIEAERIGKDYDGRTVIADFSTRVQRGDRVGIIGANGAGKSTLVGLMTGSIAPDHGTLKLGTKLEIAYIDQRRAALRDAMTVRELLAGGSDYVDVRGTKQHIAGYLKSFLFDPAQAQSPVASLSGGERNRLLMAAAFARNANLVVLDEPTNDLDMDTLDLLEDVLADFDGTVILVSHDRDFLDRVVTSVIALDGKGGWSEHAGGYSDWERETGGVATAAPTPAKAAKEAPARPKAATKLSYKDARMLDALPGEIAGLETQIAAFETRLGDTGLFNRDPVEFASVTEALSAARMTLAAKEEQWLELELKRAELAG